MTTDEIDRTAILTLHKDWWEANCGLDIPLMQSVFPSDDAYLMFNLNGHPYFGLEEKTTLWEHYATRIRIGMSDVRIMRLDISGDMAYIAAEAVFPVGVIPEVAETDAAIQTDSVMGFSEETRIRATEIYKRDDGAGAPEWKMWHFHCSTLPAADEPRPAFGDTAEERGLGFVPGHESISVVGK